jgi:murein DD-endopeptidase MepM/ murein hydrolase activator NlpD
VDLMSDFVSVHKNITSMVQSLGNKDENKQAEEIDVYLRKAEVIEEKIKNITASEEWIDEKGLDDQSALKDAEIDRDVAIKTNNLLKQKIEHLEGVIASLQSFELDVLKKIESISDKEIDKIKSSISTVNSELKRRGKYFNPLANSKKDNKGGVFVPDSLSVVENDELSNQALKTFESIDTNNYYKEAMKKIPLGKPVWTYWLSSPFGKRKDPFNAKSAAHKGVDLASNTGNKIKTMAEGKVTRAGWATGYGKVIEIDHGNGFKTKYGHLNKIYVNKGQQVAQNEAIGEVGNTGRSTGPHLHYEVLYNGVPLNPMVFIKAK